MAISDLTSLRPPFPAREFLLRGTPLDVVHTSGGKGVTRTAVVNVETVTFLERGGARKVSSASVTFLENVGVSLEDTIRLPDEVSSRKVIRVSSRFGVSVQADGRLTTCLLR